MKRPLRLLLSTKLMRALVQPPGPHLDQGRAGKASQGPGSTPSQESEVGLQQSQEWRKEQRPTWVPPPALLLNGLETQAGTLALDGDPGPQSHLSIGREGCLWTRWSLGPLQA